MLTTTGTWHTSPLPYHLLIGYYRYKASYKKMPNLDQFLGSVVSYLMAQILYWWFIIDKLSFLYKIAELQVPTLKTFPRRMYTLTWGLNLSHLKKRHDPISESDAFLPTFWQILSLLLLDTPWIIHFWNPWMESFLSGICIIQDIIA